MRSGTSRGFRFFPEAGVTGDEKKLVLRAARRALRVEMPRRVAAVEAAPDSAFRLSPDHEIIWDGEPIARLRPGRTVLRPQIEILDSEFLDGAQRERLRARLQRLIDAAVEADLAPLFAAVRGAAEHAELRGPLHRLIEGLGIIAGNEMEMGPGLRRRLKAIGVKAGRFALFLPALLKPRARAMRARLWAVPNNVPVPMMPDASRVSFAPPPDWPDGFPEAMGWLQAGPILVRLDVAEQIAAELAWASRRGAVAIPPGLASRLSVGPELLPVVLRRLGFRIAPGATLPPDMYGPPAPAMLASIRRRRAPAPARSWTTAPPGGPFAALATLKL